MVRVIIKQPGCPAKHVEWESMDELHNFFDLFTTAVSSRDWVALCEDNGYAMRLKPNFRRVTDGHIIVGPVVFVGNGRQDYISLSRRAIDEIINDRPYMRGDLQ